MDPKIIAVKMMLKNLLPKTVKFEEANYDPDSPEVAMINAQCREGGKALRIIHGGGFALFMWVPADFPKLL